MKNLLLEAITHDSKTLSKKKPTVKRLSAYYNSLGANNWDEFVVEETLCILRTKGIINENYKILTTKNTNTLPSDEELLETPLVSGTDDPLPDPSLFLSQESQSFNSNSTTPVIHSAVTSVTSTSRIPKRTLIITNMI